jgi:O-antigen/teichoic acid export membrane protein
LLCIAFSEELMTLWFAGRMNSTSADAIALIPPYAAGAAFLALSSMPYGLLNAAGRLRSHVVASLTLALCMAVALIAGSVYAGARGAVTLWSGSAALFFLIWPQVVHRNYLEGEWWHWMGTVAFFALPLGLASCVLKYCLPNSEPFFHRLAALAVAWMLLQGMALWLLWFRYRRQILTLW